MEDLANEEDVTAPVGTRSNMSKEEIRMNTEGLISFAEKSLSDSEQVDEFISDCEELLSRI